MSAVSKFGPAANRIVPVPVIGAPVALDRSPVSFAPAPLPSVTSPSLAIDDRNNVPLFARASVVRGLVMFNEAIAGEYPAGSVTV